MANHTARRSARAGNLPIPDKSGPRRPLVDFDVPEELWPEAKTQDFGDIRVISLRILTPLEEKAAVARARGDSLQLAYELARASIAEVSDRVEAQPDEEDGGVAAVDVQSTAHPIRDIDGTREMLWSQMHAKIRTLVMQGYADIAAPSESAAHSFTSSRRLRV